ncbi:MAG TPA: hypothetical protein VHR88_13335 [Solirubrobacteraceae bacterium]|nr:hypothetical protein [Solirubrobacteraceae bacterium]
MTRRPLLTLAIAALLAVGIVAVAAAATTKTKSKTVTVLKGKTRTAIVPYPNALQQGNAKYKCSASVVSGNKSKVKISKGSAEGGSVCQAKITNKGSSSAKVKVTATTTTP